MRWPWTKPEPAPVASRPDPHVACFECGVLVMREMAHHVQVYGDLYFGSRERHYCQQHQKPYDSAISLFGRVTYSKREVGVDANGVPVGYQPIPPVKVKK